jgi:hypothetical protein
VASYVASSVRRLDDISFVRSEQHGHSPYFSFFFLQLSISHSNDKDSIALVPIMNYHHVGIQVRLYKDAEEKPHVTYPAKSETYTGWLGRLWR